MEEFPRNLVYPNDWIRLFLWFTSKKKKKNSTIIQLLVNYINIIIIINLINSKKAFKIFIDKYLISLIVKGERNEKQ